MLNNTKQNHTIMKKIFLCALSLLLIVSSCSKEVMFEDVTENTQNANSQLNICTRASADANGDATISYPVHIYVFDEEDNCTSYSTLSTSEDAISLNLIEGTYTVYSVAGTDAENYSIPAKENATATSVVELLDGKQHSDVMSAKNVVTLVDGEENTLTLAMERKVMQLQEVKIKNVPSATTNVSVVVAPLYKNICINGTYDGDNGSHNLQLTKEEGTKIWSNTASHYLMPASSSATITVKITNDNGTKSYSYTCADELIANYKIKIEGTYTDKVGVTLTGTITGATWAGEKTITFEFDEQGSTGDTTTNENENPDNVENGEDEGSEDEGTGDNTSDNIPAVGTFYQNCYVLKHDVNEAENITTVTLLMTELIESINLSGTDQTAIKQTIDNALANYKVNGIGGWRLINADEYEFIKNNISDINNTFKANHKQEAFITGGSSLICYYYQKDINTIHSFAFRADLSTANFDVDGSTRLRPVTTLTFSNN